MTAPVYKRILLKLSGEALEGAPGTGGIDFPTLGGNRLDRLLDRRGPGPKATDYRKKIDASSHSDQFSALRQARQGLIHRRTIAEMKQPLRGHRSAFG